MDKHKSTSMDQRPYFISAATAAARAREAYDRGELGFQNGRTECTYHYDTPNSDGQDVVCALGAALPRKTIVEGLDIGELIAIGFIATDDANSLRLLQALHDSACVSGKAEDIRTFVLLLDSFDVPVRLAA